MKVCCLCNQEKPLSDFYSDKSRTDGVSNKCSTCSKVYQSKYRKANRPKINQWFRNNIMDWKKQNLTQWKLYFEQKYGTKPHCQVCNAAVVIFGGEGRAKAHFDHRTGNEPIQSTPYCFCTDHPLNESNKKLWDESDFGILCMRCNMSLPTNDRIEWLRQALDYAVEARS